MILQALNQLYERLADDPAYGLPVPGYSVQKITFRIVLKPDGTLHDITDARENRTQSLKSGKTRTTYIPRQMLVPGNSKPPGQGINPCTLWDNTAYLLGYKKPDPKKPEKSEKDSQRALETFQASQEHHSSLESEISDPAFSAVCRFLEQWNPETDAETWKEKLDNFAATGFGMFRVLPEREHVHECPAFRNWWASRPEPTDNNEVVAQCLVTHENVPIARLADPPIKGVNGAAPGGAKLASFNLNAFESYTKNQTYNSPVSKKATFQYCNALNALLGGPQSHRHRIVIGDATTVFWTERESTTESIFAEFLSGQAERETQDESVTSDDPVKHARLTAFLKTMRKGGGASAESLGDDPDTRFFILGLSGNVTRLAVRFWHVGTIREMLERLRSHYEALRIVKRFDRDPDFPPAQWLLDQTARERKAVSPLLGGQLMQAILGGTRYPLTLYNGVLNRLRANDKINYLKAAILKAILIRNFNQTIPMSLDTERTEPAYLLGRLFAALEKTQEDALGNINATISDRFYSSASATPRSVFPRILRSYRHHLSKLEGGRKVNRDKLVQSIFDPQESFPAHLTLEEQGLFAIGYYHQRQAFFTKTSKLDENQTTKAS